MYVATKIRMLEDTVAALVPYGCDSLERVEIFGIKFMRKVIVQK